MTLHEALEAAGLSTNPDDWRDGQGFAHAIWDALEAEEDDG